MFIGANTNSKLEIVIYLIVTLLEDGKCESNFIKNKFNITNQTLIRYISTLKNAFADFGFYHLDIYYDRENKVYRLKKNS